MATIDSTQQFFRYLASPSTTLTVPSAHLVGIGGSGMKSLADFLAAKGCRITGSDQASSAIAQLKTHGFRIHSGHDDAHLPEDVDLLIHSSAVTAENPERIAATTRDIPQLSYAETLGRMMRDHEGIAIAGTHGKSTVAAMIATILRQNGKDPSAIIGAAVRTPVGPRAIGWAGRGDYLVTESCEYQSNFLNGRPKYAAVLNVEHDHVDCFPTVGEVHSAFQQFIGQVSSSGLVLLRDDIDGANKLREASHCRVVSFSTKPSLGWWSAEAKKLERGQRFRLFNEEKYAGEITISLPGRHNQLNAVAAAAFCAELGVPFSDIREGLWAFRGLSRRFEYRGSWRGRLMYDDYAHHPTAVEAVIETARRIHPDRNVRIAFEPHQSARLNAFREEFAAALSGADEVLVAPVFTAREETGDPVELAQNLAKVIEKRGTPAKSVASLDHIVTNLDDTASPGDVLITMGAGQIDRVHDDISKRLQRYHAAG
ncbi:UDP-N-acetylmuramate--L-alanine ligase [Calycomorphotria hydatis]|uniref:UDP-N-acetylmuramate--L-alanine ligase n=1 Tax=Calycomorphotria hydatis TaxID=2528027 RepID=A0A517T6E9_9PLAN|nr:UDP-N-acetylmuramate--L-alanine ligase [Calycomorphotria hydatis]QDT63955.1 UDP-N-acetylmuramate--L-alanine ligase MurC [Calycomorphotria hydatis]